MIKIARILTKFPRTLAVSSL